VKATDELIAPLSAVVQIGTAASNTAERAKEASSTLTITSISLASNMLNGRLGLTVFILLCILTLFIFLCILVAMGSP
jgi:hypothetical protein